MAPDPRIFRDSNLPPWIILTNPWHTHRYDGAPRARLSSLRMSVIRRKLPETLRDIRFEEFYTVNTNPGREHGRHWHKHKVELMTVLSGCFHFELIDPRNGNQVEEFIYWNSNRALLVLPGTLHRVWAKHENSQLLVFSSTEHNDELPDPFSDWPDDI